VAGSNEHGSKASVTKNGEEFIEKLGDYQLPKDDSVPWN
jgi:hypothetical protein